MDAFVPQHMTRHLAAALTGHSRVAIDVLIESGVLADERGHARWSRIPTAQIENLRHRPISAADFLEARAALARTRNRQPCRAGERSPTQGTPDECRAF